jgi:integrase
MTQTAVVNPGPDDDPDDRQQTLRQGRRRANGEGTIGRRKDGRYEAKVFVSRSDGTYARRSVYGKTRTECGAAMLKLQARAESRLPVSTTNVIVGDYLTYWLHQIAEPAVRRTTFASYELLARLYLIPGLGRRRLRDLRAPHIRTWLNTVAQTCQCCAQGKDARRAQKPGGTAHCCAKGECCGSVPSDTTVRYLLKPRRAALQAATEEELIERNVARLVKLRTTPGRKIAPLTVQESRQFLAVTRTHRLPALWAVALGIGLRRGETLGLKWSDVDLDRGRLTVRRSLQRVDGNLTLHQTKTSTSERTIPLPQPLIRALREHRGRQLEERFTAGTTWEEHDLIFCTAQGRLIEPRNINRMFTALLHKANLRPIRLHDLRHSCATLLFAQGVEAATVQRILGHSSITVTTSTYVDVIEQVQHDALSKLDVLFEDDDQSSS